MELKCTNGEVFDSVVCCGWVVVVCVYLPLFWGGHSFKGEWWTKGWRRGHRSQERPYMVWTNYLRGLLTIGLRLICYIICLLACVLLPNDVLSLTEVLTFSFFFPLHIGRNKEVFLSGKTLVFLSWFHVMDITTFDMTTSPSNSTRIFRKAETITDSFQSQPLIPYYPDRTPQFNLIHQFNSSFCLSVDEQQETSYKTDMISYHPSYFTSLTWRDITPPHQETNKQTNQSITQPAQTIN